ncbi:glycosyltransferase family 2 protein [Polaribacter batillariae]|uniref:Glycosyltransferase family 2 protein n=1 Tax=Polaribacter batillariae TaxID=2808900 RepID=A0ABX7STS4_9FLAO|nr:glycosyltransferase family 2 protein [Polaribacter batillariae]QTD37571.1 glycosyltransferase family 2 protein [Polaribacter batillariae]
MKFSLIICTYMRPKALFNLLKSVQLQSFYPNEIIVVDSSTNNNTNDLLKKNSFKNLSYYKVSEENRGLTKQRNFGISKIAPNIDIVCFLDDDILLEKEYFKNLLETYKIYPEALAVGGYISNEVNWIQKEKTMSNEFYYDGWARKESVRFLMRKKLKLLDSTAPGFMPTFSNGRSISFLPPSGKTYPVELIMGGVSSYKRKIFKNFSFSNYFEGYGLYEDADFSLRLAKVGKLYINTAAKLEHHHSVEGRPNKFKYGKMVVRNGWYVWRIKYKNPSLKARFKWNSIAILLLVIRFFNVFNSQKKMEALTESFGRFYGLISLIFSKPNLKL